MCPTCTTFFLYALAPPLHTFRYSCGAWWVCGVWRVCVCGQFPGERIVPAVHASSCWNRLSWISSTGLDLASRRIMWNHSSPIFISFARVTDCLGHPTGYHPIAWASVGSVCNCLGNTLLVPDGGGGHSASRLPVHFPATLGQSTPQPNHHPRNPTGAGTNILCMGAHQDNPRLIPYGRGMRSWQCVSIPIA